MSIQQASRAQHLALNPTSQVWISANAGTGKTEVLVRRILRLLIEDATLLPSNILGLTFTRAAAAEMQERLTRTVQTWATHTHEDARATLLQTNLNIPNPSPQQVARVLALPGLVAQHPPLLTTIHALGSTLVTRLGAQAGLPVGATLLTQAGQQALQTQAMQQALALTLQQPALAHELHILLSALGEFGWRNLTQAIYDGWDDLLYLHQSVGVQAWLQQLHQHLGLHQPAPHAQLQQASTLTPALVQALQQLSPHTPLAQKALAANPAQWYRPFFTKENELRKTPLSQKAERACPAQAQAVLSTLHTLAPLVQQQAQWASNQQAYQLTQAMVVWGSAVQGHYHTLKQQQGQLDFNDLLNGLEQLLQQPDDGVMEQVWQSLGQRIRHVLVDEAQDNNPQQARIITCLVQQVLSGGQTQGTGTELPPTALAVGDLKQSIYRFQGAQPEYFNQLAHTLQSSGGTHATQILSLQHSFRSSPPLLQVVDTVFQGTAAGTRVIQGTHDPWTPHHSVTSHQAGWVELWPLVIGSNEDSEEDISVSPEIEEEEAAENITWPLPQQRVFVPSGDVVLAQQLATRLLALHRQGWVVPSTGQPLQWADVMVLVQTNQAAAIVSGMLQRAGIPVQAARVPTPSIIQDLAALMQWVLQPGSMHALATVLKSPACGCTDAHLIALHQASPQQWFPALTQQHPQVATGLTQWQQAAGLLTPHDWVHRVTTSWGQAQHPAVLAVRSMAAQVTSLAHLLQQVQQQDKWDQIPSGTNSVQVRTVHGAKGLGSPLVVLAQTTRDPASQKNPPPLLWQRNGQGLATGVLVRQGSSNGPVPSFQQVLQQAETDNQIADNMRLFYVALTRAKDALWVLGSVPLNRQGQPKSPPADCWWQQVSNALQVLGASSNHPQALAHALPGTLTWQAGTAQYQPAQSSALAPQTQAHVPLTSAGAPVCHTNHAIFPNQFNTPPPYASAETAWGELVHQVLQASSSYPLQKQQQIADYAQQQATQLGLSNAQAQQAVQQAQSVLTTLPWLQNNQNIQELELILPTGQRGRLDALVWHQNTWWVVDYKTSEPQNPLPNKYIKQVQGYIQALQQAQNTSGETTPLKGAIVYTQTAQWVPIPT